MDKHTENENGLKTKLKNCRKWILMVSVSPIAILVLILMASYSLFRFLCRAALLFIIVAINTPFAVLYNVSILVFEYNLARVRNSNAPGWNRSDPRASVGIEVRIMVSDFLKVVAGELLLVFSSGVITYYTAPLEVFYISTAVWLVAIFHKWMNTDCLSKTAISCLCGGYGLNPLMFLFSFIGLFDIGCHPVAKCSFAASRAFLFVTDLSNPSIEEEDGPKPVHAPVPLLPIFDMPKDPNKSDIKFTEDLGRHGFKRDKIVSKDTSIDTSIDFPQWNAFERGLFNLSPRINFKIETKGKSIHKTETRGKCILKSSMMLRLLDIVICECEYPVETLELPEDYSKVNELYNFLDSLSSNDGFVTDKMRGRCEFSLSLVEIAEGVEKNVGYNIVGPIDNVFVVAGCTKKSELELLD